MKIIARLSILTFALVCSGCVPVPYHAVMRPGVDGYVVDARTGQPIGGADITLSSTNFFQGVQTDYQVPTFTSQSTADGAFSIPPQKKLRAEPTPNFAPNDGDIECQLIIEHTNYEPYRLGFRFPDASLFWPLPLTTNLSKIYLKPLHQ